MSRKLTEQEEIIADITGCIIGSITACEQLIGTQKIAVMAKGDEALKILHQKGFSFEKEEVDYANPQLPTYIVKDLSTGDILFRMKSIHEPASKWYHYFTR